MKFSPELLVGILFLVALVVLGVVTILVADIPVWTTRGPVWEVMFETVSGLEPGNNVSVSGMVVGRVAKMELQTDGKVKVFLEIRQGQELVLHEGYAIMVKDISALGGKVVDIRIGDPLNVEVDPRRLKGTVVPNVLDAGGELVSALKDDLGAVMANLRTITDDIRGGKGVMGQLIGNPDLGDKARDMVGDAHDSIKRISSFSGDILALFLGREAWWLLPTSSPAPPRS